MEPRDQERKMPAFAKYSVWLLSGIFLIYLFMTFAFGGRPAAPAVHVRPSPKSPTLQDRIVLETSGFSAILENIEPWPINATLKELADAWDRIGYRNIEQVDALLGSNTISEKERVRLLFVKVMFCNFEGIPEESYRLLEEIRGRVHAAPDLEQETLATVLFLQGVVGLRRGENENCVMCRGESSCIIPISKSAVHTFPAGSRLAIKHFTEYLERFPDDLEARWLLNIAHMTLGEYPDGVSTKYLVPLNRFIRSPSDIGKFRDVGHLVGVNRFNQAGGSVMDDFDNDGYLDLAVSSFDAQMPIAFYRNKADGTFQDQAEKAEIRGQTGGLFCCQTDYDNDGNLDIWVTRGAWLPYPMRPSLLKNNGDGTFTDVTEKAGMQEPLNSNSAAWGDYDNDGWLDLYIPCEQQASRLYHNNGDGTFKEVATLAGVDGSGRLRCKGAFWIDYDNDDDLDLFITYIGNPATLFRNNGEGTFSDVTTSLGIQGPTIGFSCWAWDYDNDGWLDIFATSYDRTTPDIVKGLLGQPHNCEPNKLYRNMGGTGFVDVTAEAGLDMVFAAMGSNYADLNNDGFLDFYLGTGEPNLATLVPNRMFLNVDGKHFDEITGSSGTGHLQKGHAVSCGDWDRDGDIDVFIEMGGATNGDKYHNVLFQNPGQGNHALTVRLVGSSSNRAALGARIKAMIAGDPPRAVYRHVSSGSSFGANPLEQSLGLGSAKRVESLEIHWPTSGNTQVFHDIEADQIIEITESYDEYRRIDVKPLPLPAK